MLNIVTVSPRGEFAGLVEPQFTDLDITRLNPSLTDQLDNFLKQESLPPTFRTILAQHYLPLADWLYRSVEPRNTPVIGINGAQGSGKSTLSAVLKLVLESKYHWQVVVLSIDDIYLTRTERKRLARSVHPLLKTRGVPGTHDVALGLTLINRLKTLKKGQQMHVPRFNKATDDRLPTDQWDAISGPVDLILFEGWCVGTAAVDPADLTQPINRLEAEEDKQAIWRHYVNQQLAGPYHELFGHIDYLMFLQVPDFDSVKSWRLEQEQKLAEKFKGEAAGLMNAQEIERFIQHYERLTRQNLRDLPERADVVLKLDRDHRVSAVIYQTQGKPVWP